MAKGVLPDSYSLRHRGLVRRDNITLDFIDKHEKNPCNILDLGIRNAISPLLEERGFKVENTDFGQDLDLDFHQVKDEKYDVVTAFEIFEHMVAPFNLLREIKADRLYASVPLDLWFAKAYWNDKDEWDRHYHEFEPRQFDMLLEKAGWKIMDSKKWVAKTTALGFRSILRNMANRYYLVYCERV